MIFIRIQIDIDTALYGFELLSVEVTVIKVECRRIADDFQEGHDAGHPFLSVKVDFSVAAPSEDSGIKGTVRIT